MTEPESSYFLWIELPEGCNTEALHREALARGISIARGPIFSTQREFGNFVRLNFGHLDTKAQREAVRKMGQLVTECIHWDRNLLPKETQNYSSHSDDDVNAD